MPATWPNPSGAYRNAAWSGGGGTAAQITLDTLDTGYPYTKLTSGAVVINRSGWVTVTAQATYTGGFTIAIQLRLNGNTTPVATGNTAATSTLTYTYQAKTGDSLALWETDQLATQAGGTGAANTFIHVNPTNMPPTVLALAPQFRAAHY